MLSRYRKAIVCAMSVLGAVLSYLLTPDQADQWVALGWMILGVLGVERVRNEPRA